MANVCLIVFLMQKNIKTFDKIYAVIRLRKTPTASTKATPMALNKNR